MFRVKVLAILLEEVPYFTSTTNTGSNHSGPYLRMKTSGGAPSTVPTSWPDFPAVGVRSLGMSTRGLGIEVSKFSGSAVLSFYDFGFGVFVSGC